MAAKNDAADLAKEIDALRRMTVRELRRRHVDAVRRGNAGGQPPVPVPADRVAAAGVG
jgi:hypothetical protein